MKTSTLTKSLAVGISGAVVFGFAFFNSVKKYSPRSERDIETSTNFSGAANYYHWLRQDPATGKINLNAMAEFQQEMFHQNGNGAKMSTVMNLAWQEMGPDNIGGRCRSILVDKNNTNRMFAGGVSAGLFISNNSGGTWTPVNDTLPNMIVSCIAQDGDGNIYFGTGEGMARGGNGDGNSAFIGAGLFKMDYNSVTDSYSNPHVIASTVPAPNNNTVSTWAYINRVKLSPTKINGNYYIYCATGDGLKLSTDNGNTFVDAITALNNKFCFDLDVCNNGAVYCSGGSYGGGNNKIYYSAPGNNGGAGTFVDVTPPTNSSMPWGSFGRIEIAASLTNSNIIYASIAKPINTGAATSLGVIQSVNAGANWSTIAMGNVNFEPFAEYGQGDYDHVLEVFPDNDYEILLGGVDMYKWSAVDPSVSPSIGSFDQASYQGGFPFFSKYIHADHHAITFHPTNPNIFFVGTDGGMFRTTDRGDGFTQMNNGFNATQFYDMSFERDAVWTYGSNIGTYNGAGVLGGTQDNGTPYINGNGNTVKSGSSINGGDGFYSEASMLSPNTFFMTSYYGFLNRTSSRTFGADFYPADRPNMITCSNTAAPGDFGFASFVTPIALYETSNLTNGVDSVSFVVDSLKMSAAAVGNGSQQTFSFALNKPQASAVVDNVTLKIVAGGQVVTSDASGNLTGSGTGTYNSLTNLVNVTFTTPPVNSTPIKVSAAISYPVGSSVSLTTASLNMKFNYNTTSALYTGDTIQVMDPIQARLAVGLTGAVYINKNPLNFSAIPNWVKVAGSNSVNDVGGTNAFTGTVQTLEWAGINHLYVATTAGVLWRISGLDQVINYEQDIDSFAVSSLSWKCNKNTECPITIEKIAGFSGRAITSIAVDPTNPDRIAVTLGNYGVTSHVYYCTNATTCAASTTTANFTQLPSIASPVYSSVFVQTSYNESNPNNLLIGTEAGVRSIDLSSPSSWSNEGLNGSGMFPNVPTFMLKQQRLGSWECYNSGVIYAATHGRGIWKSNNFYSPLNVSVPEIQSGVQSAHNTVKVFPNPADDMTNVNFSLAEDTRVMVNVYDLKGSKLKTVNCGKLNKGAQTIQVNLDGLTKGTYIIALSSEEDVLGTCRFVKISD